MPFNLNDLATMTNAANRFQLIRTTANLSGNSVSTSTGYNITEIRRVN